MMQVVNHCVRSKTLLVCSVLVVLSFEHYVCNCGCYFDHCTYIVVFVFVVVLTTAAFHVASCLC